MTILGYIPLLFFPVVGICEPIPKSQDITVLFQNDGNWTTHADKPSAILVLSNSSRRDAVDSCASYGEELLSCDDFSAFHDQLQYQVYLGELQQSQALWSSCSERPFMLDGAVSHTDDLTELPFLCTNSAPTVKKVDTDFSTFPHVNVTSNSTSFEGLRDHMAFRFMGIPFAKSPTGDLRFQYAQPWNGTYVNATKYGPACLQYGQLDGSLPDYNPWGISEDCLSLNVFTPHIPVVPTIGTAPKLKPVLFWMHGGAFDHGSGMDGTFDGASLVSRGDVVLVTVNYRLSIFGFLTLNDTTVTGNYDTSDKIEALRWVQNHIAAFGGDPNNVTIFGQSAGGASVLGLIQSPKAAGLFNGAIAQSSGDGSVVTASEAASQVLPFIDNLCPSATGVARLKCLRALPAEELLELTETNVTSWSPVIDNIYFEDTPVSQIAKGRQYINNVKLMLGYMPDEGQSLMGDTIPPNITSLENGLEILQQTDFVNDKQVEAVLNSPLWAVSNCTGETTRCNSSSEWAFNNVYNATVNVASDSLLTGPGVQVARVGAASYSFDQMWIYRMERAYALSYYNPWGLCSFPIGQPEVPYYKCHSGDLYEVFGTYHLFDQPIRADDDVHYTNAIQDMWASFAQTGNPNVDKSYLRARGYNSTLAFFSDFVWPSFDAISPQVASLQFPGPGITTLPDQERIAVLMPLA